MHPQIDFVAHDDIPYNSAGSEDVYKHIKEAGETHSCAHCNRIEFLVVTFSCLNVRHVCGHRKDGGHLHV